MGLGVRIATRRGIRLYIVALRIALYIAHGARMQLV